MTTPIGTNGLHVDITSFRNWLCRASDRFLEGIEPSLECIARVNERHVVKLAQPQFGSNTMSLEEMQAYIRTVFLNNSCFAKTVLFRCPEFRDFIRDKSFSKDRHVKVVCFGCGPGSECLALLSYIKHIKATVAVNFFLFDLNDWSDSIAFFLSEYCSFSQTSGTSSFTKADVLCQEFLLEMEDRVCLKKADVFILSKFACQIHTNKAKDIFYENLFRTAKEDSFVILVDRVFKYAGVSDVLFDVEKIAKDNGFQVVCTSSNADGSDFDLEYDEKFHRKSSFRFLQKCAPKQTALINGVNGNLRPGWQQQNGGRFRTLSTGSYTNGTAGTLNSNGFNNGRFNQPSLFMPDYAVEMRCSRITPSPDN